MINQFMETIKKSINTENISASELDISEANNDKLHTVILLYAGPKGNNINKSMNNNI